MNSTPLQGRRALVTGLVQGIGLAIAKALVRQGASVVLHGLPDPRAQETARQAMVGSSYVLVDILSHDSSDPGQVQQMMDEVLRAGPLDIPVNNAGIQHTAPLAEMPRARWDAIQAINLSAAFDTVRQALPGMQARGYGRIVNIAQGADTAGRRAQGYGLQADAVHRHRRQQRSTRPARPTTARGWNSSAATYTPVHPRRKRITLLELDEIAAGASRVRLRSENANRDVALIYVLFCTGAKPIEIARLEVRDCLNIDGSIRERSEMRAETAVNGRSRPLFFTSSRACAAVDAYLVERRRRKLGSAGSPATSGDAFRGLDPCSALFLTEGGWPFEIAERGPNDRGKVPVPLHVVSPFAEAKERAIKEKTLAGNPSAWVWVTDQSMPPLPQRN